MTRLPFRNPGSGHNVKARSRARVDPASMLVASALLLSSAGPAQAQELPIVGFLQVPQLYVGWTTEWEKLPPDHDFELMLHRRPSPASDVVARITSGEELEATEFEYEELGALVFGRSDGWSLVRTHEGVTGWAEPIEGARFHSLEDHLPDRLTYLTRAFEGGLASTPGGRRHLEIPADPRRRLVGTLEPGPPTRTRIVLEPGEDPDSVARLHRAGGYRLSAHRSDGTRDLILSTGDVHPLFSSPDSSTAKVGEVETHRPGWAVYTVGGSGAGERILVFDTRPGWFQVAIRSFEWRKAPRAWLQEVPGWTFHPLESAQEASEVAEGAFGPGTVSVEVLEVQRVNGDPWARIEVHADSPCYGGEELEIVAEGWIPLHAPSGEANVWFYSRGC